MIIYFSKFNHLEILIHFIFDFIKKIHILILTLNISYNFKIKFSDFKFYQLLQHVRKKNNIQYIKYILIRKFY